MLAYLFWHRPGLGQPWAEYESPLVAFHGALNASAIPGLLRSECHRISETPWMDGSPGYEDWCYVESSAALDTLNGAAASGGMADVHTAIARRMGQGHGGLYSHVLGDVVESEESLVHWLTRPRGVDGDRLLREVALGVEGAACAWRRMMVLGPAPEYAVVTGASDALEPPDGWDCHTVERTRLFARGTVA